MYRHNEKQLEFIDFELPFGGKLLANNRWIRLGQLIPWEDFAEAYCRHLSKDGQGPPALSVRMALGALIIKERLRVSDEECVEQIRENPYLQHFCGLKAFTEEPPFHPTMLVLFRKRFPAKTIAKINEAIALQAIKAVKSNKTNKLQKQDDDKTDNQPPFNHGKLLLDATCTPADIGYPTDFKLLNKAREKSEQIIDTLHKQRGSGHKKRNISQKS